MPSNTLDPGYIESVIEIKGLRSPSIKLNSDGSVSIGCMHVMLKDMRSYSPTMIRAQYGTAGVEWWATYKEVICSFLELCYEQRKKLETKYKNDLKEDPNFLVDMLER